MINHSEKFVAVINLTKKRVKIIYIESILFYTNTHNDVGFNTIFNKIVADNRDEVFYFDKS